MKKSDKIIIGIVGAVVLLVIVKIAPTLNNSTFHAEDKPEDVAFNYLFAMQHRDYERAYEYLSPDMDGYPRDVGTFIQDIQDYEGSFYGMGDTTRIKIGPVKMVGSNSTVRIILEHIDPRLFNVVGDFNEEISVTLQQDLDNKWKIVYSQTYWFSCWSTPSICGIGPTPTPSAPKGTVTLGPPENPQVFTDSGKLLTMQLSKRSQLLETAHSSPFYICPNVWIDAAADQEFPTFTLYFDSSWVDEGKGYLVALYPVSSEESDRYAEIGFVPTSTDGKFLLTASYQPFFKQPNPGEYEIQLVFTGCEIYTARVTWCLDTSNGCTDEQTNTSIPVDTSTPLPVSASPVIASVEETKNFIGRKGGYMQALWLSGLYSYATTFPDQDRPYQPGDILIYKINLSETTSALWVHEACAPTQEVLDEMFSNITIEFILNNELVPLSSFASIEGKFFGGNPCRSYVALINQWSSGDHILETRVTYEKSYENIGSGQLIGTYIWKFLVNVHP